MPLFVQALLILYFRPSAPPPLSLSLRSVSGTTLLLLTTHAKCTVATQHAAVLTVPDPAQVLLRVSPIRLNRFPGSARRPMALSGQALFCCSLRPSVSPAFLFTLRSISSTPLLPLATVVKRTVATQYTAVDSLHVFFPSLCPSLRPHHPASHVSYAASTAHHQRKVHSHYATPCHRHCQKPSLGSPRSHESLPSVVPTVLVITVIICTRLLIGLFVHLRTHVTL